MKRASRKRGSREATRTARHSISRREFLNQAAILGGAAAVGSLAGWPFPRRAGAQPIPFGLDLRTPTQPIDHVIVLMMENRSFDHYFGWRTGTNQRTYTGDYPEAFAKAQAGTANAREANKAAMHGEQRSTFHLSPDFRGCNPGGPESLQPYIDPDHSWDGGRRQLGGGTPNFLVERNDEFAIGYYEESDVEFYAKLSRQFTLCDDYFCSVMGPTFPNREYMHSAWSGGQTTNNLPPQVPGMETGFTWTTIWDLLSEVGVPWAYYFVDLPAIGLWGSRGLAGARHIEHFFEDAYAGTLPNVVFVDPGFTTGFRTDEHPYGDIRSGQAFAHNVVKAIVESPLWGRSVLFVNYDEWGGFFDHVVPGTVNDETIPLGGSLQPKNDGTSFTQLGWRVPCTIVSPYAPKGVLSSQVIPGRTYDHVSILKYVKERFGTGSLSQRHAASHPAFFSGPVSDRHGQAANIGDLLLSEPDPERLDPAFVVDALPRPLVHSCPCPHEVLEGIAGQVSDAERQATEPADNGFEELAAFLDGIGAPVTPPRSTHDLICKVL